MKDKQNVNYFMKSGWMKPTGLGLLIAGIAFLFFGWGFISYILMVVFIPAGIVLFIVGASTRSTDAEMDEFIAKKYENFEVRLDLDKDYSKRLLKHVHPENFESYVYDEGLLYAKSNTGYLRTSEYQKTILHMLSDAIYVSVRRISLVEDKVDDKIYEIPYAELSAVSALREERSFDFNKKSFSAKVCEVRIEYGGGLVLIIPTKDNANIDAVVEKINKMRESA